MEEIERLCKEVLLGHEYYDRQMEYQRILEQLRAALNEYLSVDTKKSGG